MQKNNMITKIKNRYFDKKIDIQAQFYNLLSFTGIATGIVVAIITVIIKEPLFKVAIDLMISALFFLLLIIAEKKQCYHLCSWILVILIFMIIFPALFLYYKGYMCGFQCFFVLAIIYTAQLLEKQEGMIGIALEFALYIACCLVVYNLVKRGTVLLPGHMNIIKMTLNFVFSGIVLLVTVILRNRMINTRQEQIQELNRELVARNETLAQYDTMKSDFLATVAHEINTPLAVIAASSSDTLDLLKETSLNTEEMEENQIIINKRVKLIDHILLDLMDTVAIENGRLSLNRQFVNLSGLLKNICEAQFNKLDINRNSITYDFQPDIPCIWVDPLRIEQVITNLLSNAVRHTKDGMVTVKLVWTDKRQIVSVTDNGEGMDAEMARIILKQYVSTKADYWRHGIGLYICRRIITAHGGDIWIDSVKGRGTTISFSLREDINFERTETFNTNHGRR